MANKKAQTAKTEKKAEKKAIKTMAPTPYDADNEAHPKAMKATTVMKAMKKKKGRVSYRFNFYKSWKVIHCGTAGKAMRLKK